MSRKEVVIITPQFTRPPGAVVPASPLADWADLDQLDRTALREMGFGFWNVKDDPDPDHSFEGEQLLLFPGEWYAYIPDDTPVVTIAGEFLLFRRGSSSDDIRFGCLAYGVLRPF